MSLRKVANSSGKRLVSIQSFIRHGDRTPVYSVGDAAFWAAALPDQGLREKLTFAATCDNISNILQQHNVWGQLSRRGIGQLFGRGRRTWRQLASVQEFCDVEKNDVKDKMIIRSTAWGRTIQSAQSFVYGFREAVGEDVEVEDTSWQIDLSSCANLRPRIDLAPTTFFHRAPHLQEEATRFDVWLQNMADELCIKEYVQGNPWTVVDYAKCLSFYGILPPRLNGDLQKAFNHMHWRWTKPLEDPQVLSDVIGHSVLYIWKNLEQPAAEPVNINIVHDVTLLPILKALGLKVANEWPVYASVLQFQLWEDDHQERFVRITWNEETQIALEISPDQFIPLQTLKAHLTPILEREYCSY